MKFQRIRIDGFGRLRDMDLPLAPGLNIFFGANEAGKSTLQQAIFALLYGYFSANRRNAAESRSLERFKPWDGHSYGGQLSYGLDSGKSFRVTRSFDDDLQTVICDAETGRDLSDQFERGRLGRLDFAIKQFAMPQDVFINTCFVRQAELHRLDEAAGQITETIVNLADTGSKDHSVLRANEILESTLKEKVGGERAPKKPLARSILRLSALKVEHDTVVAQRSLLEADYEARGALKQRVQAAELDRDRVTFLLAAQRLSGLRARTGQVEKLDAVEAEITRQIGELSAVANFPLEKREVVTRLSQDWRRINQAAEKQGQSITAASSQASQWQMDVEALREQVRSLEHSRGTPIEQEQPLRDLERTWRAAVDAALRADEQFATSAKAAADAAPASAAAQGRAPLVAVGPDKVHDLRLAWDTANQRVVEAELDAAKAEAAWMAQHISAGDYAALRYRVAKIDPGQIAELKRMQASTRTAVTTPISAPDPAQTVNGPSKVLVITAIVLAIAGLALLTLGLLNSTLVLAAPGAVLLAAAVGAAVMSRRSAPRAQVPPSPRRASETQPVATLSDNQLTARLSALGFATLEELETAAMRYLQVRPIYDAWVAATAKVARVRLERESIEAGLAPLLSMPVGTILTAELLATLEFDARQLAERIRDLEYKEQQKVIAQQNAVTRRAELQQAEQRVRQLLAVARIAGPDRGTDIRAFYALCEQSRQLAPIEPRIRELEAKLAATRTASTELANTRMEGDAVGKALQQIFVEVGISETNQEVALTEFERRSGQAESLTRCQQDLQSRLKERVALLQSQSLAQLNEQAAAAQCETDALCAEHPEFSSIQSVETPQALQAISAAVQQRLIAATSELAAVESRLASSTAHQRSLAEIDEEILALQARVGQLMFHGEVLQLALDNLAAAADEHHRNFLPSLNQIVGSSLAVVTGGRYQSVQIDHSDLQVRIELPESNQVVTPDQLSRGAQEQIYLLLRLGLTELMSEGRERLPLVLDDPLVNYDHSRLLHALDFLAKLAEQTQILLFTKDDTTAAWFAANHALSKSNQLHLLDAATQPT
jgi:AAA domain